MHKCCQVLPSALALKVHLISDLAHFNEHVASKYVIQKYILDQLYVDEDGKSDCRMSVHTGL